MNLAQERLVELVAASRDPFIVGDDDQSIYRFRGASRASLERFLRTFPQARTVTLGVNRRSSTRIVAAASALIGHNPERLLKRLRAEQTGPAVEVWRCADGSSEAASIAREAGNLAASGVPLSTVAILCRTNAIARPIAAALVAAGLPHVVFGGHGFLDRPEVKDLIAVLRAVWDPADLVALERINDRPATVALRPLLESFAAAATRIDVRDLFFDLMERTRYLDHLRASLEASEAERATANVSRFGEQIAEFCETSPDHSLHAYLRHLELVLLSGEDEEPAAPEQGDAIQVMTIHQSKGLEFDAVFVPSLVEGRLPQSARSPRFELPPFVLEPLVRGREDVIAEERRLLYVAMTRARRHLYLTWAAHYEGGRRWRESRFLEEVQAAGIRTVVLRDVAASSRPSARRGDSPLNAPGLAKPVPGASLCLPSPRSGEGEIVLSYSSIAAYLDCPRQYWYRYVQRLPAAQSAEAVQGVIIHETLRRAAEAKRAGATVTADMLSALHSTVWGDTAFPDPRRAPTFPRNGAAQREAYRQR